jgi:two-component system nitrate/nitrite response regulator NarL
MITETIRPLRAVPAVPTTDRIHVLIADDDGLARRMIRSALQETDIVSMVVTAGDAREALELARYYRPAVLIVDADLPPRGALDLVRSVLAALPGTRVLTVSAAPEAESVLAALRAGAVGFVDKDIDPQDLARVVLRAMGGEAILPRRMIMPVLEALRELPEAGWRPLYSRLTTREWQIVELLAAGVSTEVIADRLVLSHATVYTHVRSLLRKLGVHSRREAVAAANRLRREEVLERESCFPLV